MLIYKGMRGNDPWFVDTFLNYRGIQPLVPASDIFDRTTEMRVLSFQRALYPFRLPQTGVVDHATFGELSPFVKADLVVMVKPGGDGHSRADSHRRVPRKSTVEFMPNLHKGLDFGVGGLTEPGSITYDAFHWFCGPENFPKSQITLTLSANGLVPGAHYEHHVQAEASFEYAFDLIGRRGRDMYFEAVAGINYQTDHVESRDLSNMFKKPGILGIEAECTYKLDLFKTGVSLKIGPKLGLEHPVNTRAWTLQPGVAMHLSGFMGFAKQVINLETAVDGAHSLGSF